MMPLSIAIAGASGRMDRALTSAASANPRFAIAGSTTRGGETVARAGAQADVWIDFTTPVATIAALDALASTPARAAIVGTTGLSADHEAKIAAHAKRIAVVRSGNFSLGVNLLAALVEQAAQKLGQGWDIEI